MTGITEKDVKDIYMIRSMLEGLCVRWATEHITQEQLEELDEIILLSEYHMDKGHSDQLTELDGRVHQILYEASQSRILDHVLSDFHKYGGEISVLDFLNKLVYYIVNVCPDTAIVINDINLASSLGGGRDYFDTLYRKLSHSGFRCCQLHFKNSVRGNQYNYGGQYFSNDLLFDPRFVNKYHSFAPYESCASAQIIIYKE